MCIFFALKISERQHEKFHRYFGIIQITIVIPSISLIVSVKVFGLLSRIVAIFTFSVDYIV